MSWLVFMLGTWAGVLALNIFCIRKVLRPDKK